MPTKKSTSYTVALKDAKAERKAVLARQRFATAELAFCNAELPRLDRIIAALEGGDEPPRTLPAAQPNASPFMPLEVPDGAGVTFADPVEAIVNSLPEDQLPEWMKDGFA